MATVINWGEMSQTYYFSIDFWKFGAFFFFFQNDEICYVVSKIHVKESLPVFAHPNPKSVSI